MGNIIKADEDSFKNIEEICRRLKLNAQKTQRGFQRSGAFERPWGKAEYIIWWPNGKERRPARNVNNIWINVISDDGRYIFETNTDIRKIKEGYKNLKEKIEQDQLIEKRITFFMPKERNENNYIFKGVYIPNIMQSTPDKEIVYERISKEFDLDNFTENVSRIGKPILIKKNKIPVV